MAAEFPRWAGEVGLNRAVSSLMPKRNLGRGRPVLVVPPGKFGMVGTEKQPRQVEIGCGSCNWLCY